MAHRLEAASPLRTATASVALAPVHAAGTFTLGPDAPSPAAASPDHPPPGDGLQASEDVFDAAKLGRLGGSTRTAPLERVLELASSMAFPSEPALEPWGLDLSRPLAANSGLLALRAGTAPQLTVREGFAPTLSCNRLLFVLGTGLPLTLLGGLPVWLATLLLSALNVTFGAARTSDSLWTEQMDVSEATDLLARLARPVPWLARQTGLGLPASCWQRPPWAASLLGRLTEPGNACFVGRQRGLGLTGSVAVLWGLFRAGSPQVWSRGESLGVARTGPHEVSVRLTWANRTRSEGATYHLLWGGGTQTWGHYTKQSVGARLPWPSARARLTCQLLVDAYVRGADLHAEPPPRSAGLCLEQQREDVHVHGTGWHLPLTLWGHRTLGVGTVRSHVAWHREAGEGREYKLSVRGLDETLAEGREQWQLSLFCSTLLAADSRATSATAGPSGGVRVAWRYTSSLAWATAHTLPAWCVRLQALTPDDGAQATSVRRSFASFPSPAPLAPAADFADLWACLEGEATWPQASEDSPLAPLRPTPGVSWDAEMIRANLLAWLEAPGPATHARLAEALAREGRLGFTLLDELLRPDDTALRFTLTSRTSEALLLAAASHSLVAPPHQPWPAGRPGPEARLRQRLDQHERTWQLIGEQLPPAPRQAAQQMACACRQASEALPAPRVVALPAPQAVAPAASPPRRPAARAKTVRFAPAPNECTPLLG